MTAELPPQSPQPTQQVPPMPGRPQPSSAWRWGCGIAIAGVLLLVMLGLFIILFMAMSLSGELEGFGGRGGRIVMVRIDGTIVAGQSGFSMFGGEASGSDDIVDQIEAAVEDEDVKGIVLRINSPGGSAAGSQEIYRAVQEARRARADSFVVVASMADVAASGGYYVAAASDVIMADEATVTGSIGAVAMHEDLSGLFEKIGVKPEVIKSGEMKDMLSPMTPMSDEARQVVQTLVEQVHEQFVQAVADGRESLDLEAVQALADGRIYTGQQAVENGLVDEIGGLREALDLAGEMSGLGPRPQVEEYGEPSLLHWLFGGSSMARGGAALQPQVSATGGLLYDGLAARLVGQRGESMRSLAAGRAGSSFSAAGDM